MVLLLDSYAESNYDGSTIIVATTQHSAGQSFTTLNDGYVYKLTSAKFYLKLNAGSTYNLTAKLHTHSGTYGTSSLPTGSALATSDAVTTGLTGSFALVTFTFSGANQINLQPNTHYTIHFTVNSGDGQVLIGTDGSAPSHGGNFYYFGVDE